MKIKDIVDLFKVNFYISKLFSVIEVASVCICVFLCVWFQIRVLAKTMTSSVSRLQKI